MAQPDLTGSITGVRHVSGTSAMSRERPVRDLPGSYIDAVVPSWSAVELALRSTWVGASIVVLAVHDGHGASELRPQVEALWN